MTPDRKQMLETLITQVTKLFDDYEHVISEVTFSPVYDENKVIATYDRQIIIKGIGDRPIEGDEECVMTAILNTTNP